MLNLIHVEPSLDTSVKMQKCRRWTDDEINILKKNYMEYTYEELASILNRSRVAVEEQIYKLNLPKKNFWSFEQEDFLRENYGKMTLEELSMALGKQIKTIDRKRKSLGLAPQVSRRWTEEELNFLIDRWSTLSIQHIASKLNRSYNSVKKRAIMLNLDDSRFLNGYLNTGDISSLLSIESYTVRYWIKYRGLKARKKKVVKKAMYYVSLEDLKIFLKNNQHLWDATYLEQNILGVEESWLKEKRKKDYYIKPMKVIKVWTNKEIDRLVNFYNNDFSIKKISKLLGRTEKSISAKVNVLKSSGIL